METQPEVELDFYLAEKLGWRSVAALRRGMSNQEWRQWSVYYARKAQRREMAAASGG